MGPEERPQGAPWNWRARIGKWWRGLGPHDHAVLGVQALLVLAALAYFLWASAEYSSTISKEFGSGVIGWSPPAWLVLTLAALLLALSAAPLYPLIGCLAYLVVLHGVPRYGPHLLFVHEVHLPGLLMFLTATGLGGWLYRSGCRHVLPRHPLLWLMLGFVTAVVLSSLVNGFPFVSPEYSLKRGPQKYLFALLGFLVALHTLTTTRNLKVLAGTLALTLGARTWIFPDVTHLSGDLGYLIPLVLPLLALAATWSKGWGRKVAWLAAFGYLGYVLVLTENRGGLVALAAAGLAFTLTLAPRRAALGLAGLAGSLALILGSQASYRQRFLDLWEKGLAQGSPGDRLEIWRGIYQLFREHPLFGVGPGRAPSLLGEYVPNFAGYTPHNNFLGLLAETGALGAGLYLALFALALWVAWRLTWRRNNVWTQRFGQAMVPALIAYLVAGCFMSREALEIPYLLCGACAAWDRLARLWREQVACTSVAPSTTAGPPLHRGGGKPPPLPPWPWARHLFLAALACTAFAVYGSWVPLHYQPRDFASAVEQFKQIPLLQLGVASRADWVANILLFIPLGFFWLGGIAVDRDRRFALTAAIPLALLLAGLSLAIEFSQLWFPQRTVSQNDIAAETLGGMLGIGLWLLWGQPAVGWVRGYAATRDRTRQMDWLLQAYALGLVIYSLVPFDLTISVGELYQKYREGKIQLIPFSSVQADPRMAVVSFLRDILLFLPLGVLAARLLRRRGETVRPFWSAFWIGVAGVAGLEFAQLLVYSRFSEVSDVFLGAIGVAAGVGLTHYLVQGSVRLGSPVSQALWAAPWKLLGGAVGYVALLLLLFWYPYDFTTERAVLRERFLDMMQARPFAALYFGTELNALMQVLFRLVVFAPLGVLFALGALRLPLDRWARQLLLVGLLLVGAGVGALIEAGQVALPSHIADLTEVLFYTAGVGIGMGLTLRLVEPVASPSGARVVNAPAPAGIPRWACLDGLRGIACLAVFAEHWQQQTRVSLQAGPCNFVRLFDDLGVCLLTVLAGCLLGLRFWRGNDLRAGKGWVKGYLAPRIGRILPVYWACLLGIVVVSVLVSRPPAPKDLLLHASFLHVYTEETFYSIAPPFWWLGILIPFYLLFPLLVAPVVLGAKASRGVKQAWVGFLCVATYASHYAVMEWLAPRGEPGSFEAVWSRSALAHLPLFLLGLAAGSLLPDAEVQGEGPRRGKNWAWELLAWVLLATLVIPRLLALDDRLGLPHGRYNFPFIPGLLALLIVTLPRTRLLRQAFELSPVAWLGLIAYGVYIYHYPILRAVARLLGRASLSAENLPTLYGLVALAGAVVVAALSYRILERPAFRWLTGRKE
jgi:peptidoglycan/LPS O-acetylase OafA/YrhL/glycopeptide antibiotics resistance protein